MDLEKMIAEKLSQTNNGNGNKKATVDDFAKYIVLDEDDVVRVNQLDIYKDENDDYKIVVENLRGLFGLIGWKLQEKGTAANKPPVKKIDFNALLKK